MLAHLIQSLLQTQGILGGLGSLFDCPGCSASAFTAISAAMTTQGYWAQSDILDLITNDNLGHLAVLMYVLAAIAGIIGMALGMPPKLYLMLFMGPGLYDWLVATKVETSGVAWQVATQSQNQGEVWKLAYPGIQSTRTFQDGGVIPPSINIGGTTMYLPPTGTGAKVSWLFAEYDGIVSDFVQNLIKWFGIYSSVPGSNGLARFSVDGNAFHLMSNLKWGMLETITSAKITDAALRDVFITFLSSECGDRFRSAVNLGSLSQANGAKGKNLPGTVFWSPQEVTRVVDTYSIPTPFTMGNLFRDGRTIAQSNGAAGSFLRASQLTQQASLSGMLANGDILSAFGANQYISCSQLLYSIVVGLRWEAGHTYAKLIGQAPALRPQAGGGDLLGSLIGSQLGDYAMTPGMVVNTLFYGWEIPNGTTGNGGINWGNFSIGGNLGSIWNAVNFGGGKDQQAQQQFVLNLITAYTIKNEFAIAPPITPTAARTSAKEDAEKFSSLYASTVGSKSKFGELYVWALMIPYLQGVFLYFLAIAYPFCCMAMVVPGWHTMLFSWMAFWAWVKLWDVGFAIVQMAERSIWAMIGNSSDAAQIFNKVAEMSSGGNVLVGCQAPNIVGASTAQASLPCLGNQVVDVLVTNSSGSGIMTMPEAIKTLDLGMLLGASLDLERANSYYIYLMAALYFAVPVVTGQLVLGSKAAAAGMVKDFIGGAASDGGRAAGSAFSAQKSAAAQINASSQSQAAMLKGMREQGIAASAIRAGNAGLARGLESQSLGQEAQGMGNVAGMLRLAEGDQKARLNYAGTQMKAPFASSLIGSAIYGSLSQNPGSFAKAAQAISANGDLAVNSAAGAVLGASGVVAGTTAMSGMVAAFLGTKASSAMGGSEKASPVEGQNLQGSPNRGFASSANGGSTGSPNRGFSPPQANGGVVGGPSGQDKQPPPSLANQVGQFLYTGNQLIANMSEGMRNYIDAVESSGQLGISTGFNQQYGMIQAAQGAYGVQSFGAKAEGDGYSAQSQREMQAANFGAAQSAWLEKSQAAQSANPYLAAIGASPAYSPGEKPTDVMGAGYLGLLGSGAKDAARYANADNPNGYFAYAQGMTNSLNSAYGYSSLLGTYRNQSNATPGALFDSAQTAHHGMLSTVKGLGSTFISPVMPVFSGANGATPPPPKSNIELPKAVSDRIKS